MFTPSLGYSILGQSSKEVSTVTENHSHHGESQFAIFGEKVVLAMKGISHEKVYR
jgi:hypothetical protein